MVEVKAYEKWVTKVMSCVSVGLFPNSVEKLRAGSSGSIFMAES